MPFVVIILCQNIETCLLMTVSKPEVKHCIEPDFLLGMDKKHGVIHTIRAVIDSAILNFYLQLLCLTFADLKNCLT